MTERLCRLRLAFVASLVAFLALGGAVPALADTTYSGRAAAVFVNSAVTGPVYLSDTGELPPSGGAQGASLLSATVPGVLSANVLNAFTGGASGNARSSASLFEADVLPGHPAHLTASFVRSQTEATCDGLTGSSEILNLTFGGQNVVVSGQPNQTVTIPGVATLIINEQVRTVNGHYGEIRVNAIHLTVPGVAEVILSSAKSDINCVPPTRKGPCHDFVTGGGWIAIGTSRGNFGFNAGFKGADVLPGGHLNYIDHGTGMKVRSTSITGYGVPDDTSNVRWFEGTCEINGQSGTFRVEVSDNGEPGRADTFRIQLSSGYSASGTLTGGNIQLHAPCSR